MAETRDFNGEETSREVNRDSSSPEKMNRHQYQWWVQMIIYTVFLLAGGAVGTLLGRIYFNNGAKSQWMATLMQVGGFPILIPFRWLKTPGEDHLPRIQRRRKKFPTILALIYIALGIFTAAVCQLYTIGLQYLPVITYTLIGASQLGFNAMFSYLLNGQKFTPYIVNSLVLLTISSVLLVFNHDDDEGSNAPSKDKHVLGFICTVGASAGYAFTLSASQLTIERIIKKETIAAIIDMSVYQQVVASIIIVVGIFASGDWRKLHSEMKGYKQGPTSYVMNLFWTAVSWQVFTVGCVGLIFKVSALFSNVISMLGTPLAPVMAVVFLGEKMTGLKGITMILASWGFVSYMYQHYLDDLEEKKLKKECDEQVAERGCSQAMASGAN